MNHKSLLHALAVVLTLLTGSAHAQSGASLRLMPWLPESNAEVEHSSAFFESGNVENTPGPGSTSIQLARHDTRGRFRIDSANPMSLSFGFESHIVDVQGPLADTFGQLVDQSAAVGFEVGQWEDVHIQGYVGMGYAGNEPYVDSDNIYGLAGLIFSKPLAENWNGLLTIQYDGNRSIFPDVPLPAFGAMYTGRKDLQLLVGFPVSRVAWQPDEHWKLELTYALLYSGKARVGYTFVEGIEAFAAVQTSMEAFDDEDDFGIGAEDRRLFFEQKTAEAGVQWTPCANASFTLAAGYAFDQEFSTGWDVRDLDNEVELSDEPFVRVAAEFKF